MRFNTVSFEPNNAKLSCYLHDSSPELQNAAVRPGILVFPGGGYMACSDREAEPVALAYMAQGYNAYVLRYTVGKDHTPEEALKDAEAALEYIKKNGAELCTDPDRIAAVGFSAGGHLAASLGVLGRIKPRLLILSYLPTLEYMSQGIKPHPSLTRSVNASTPPAFIWTTQNDTMVPVDNSLAFALELAKFGIPFELHVFLSGDHGLSLAVPSTSGGSGAMVNEDAAQWFPLSVKWLKNMWGDFAYSQVEKVPGDEPGKKRRIDTAFRELRKNGLSWEVVKRYIPGIEAMIERDFMLNIITPRNLKGQIPGLTAETLEQMNTELDKT
ncbi:MAG: alpha/beta hydrolase [Treponema sp.]|jgi:acetyl esterase/lipase|nr:alpha/beta hydrolase [Treponema sp.]